VVCLVPKTAPSVRTYLRKYARQGGKAISYRAVVRYPDPDRPHHWLERTKVFHKERDAKRWIQQVAAEHAQHPHFRPATDVTVEDLLTRWLTTVAQPRVRPSTYRTYAGKAQLAIAHLGAIPVARLQPMDIQGLYRTLLDAGKAPATVQRVHVVLHRALADAVGWGLVAGNAADHAKPPRVPPRDLAPPDADQVARLLQAAQDDRLYALWAFLALTGVRKGEALALQWGDIDEAARVAYIRRTLVWEDRYRGFGPPKTASGQRAVALSDAVLDILRAHRQQQDADRQMAGDAWQATDLVFTTRHGRWLNPSNVHRAFKRLVVQAGLPPGTRIHDLRHALATRWLAAREQPRVVAEQLGHANVSITLGIYGHVTAAMRRDAADRDAADLLAAARPDTEAEGSPAR